MDLKVFDMRSFREAHGLSQQELADLLGIKQGSVSRMEINPEQITLTTVMKLAQCFGMTLDQLTEYELPIPNALEVTNTWTGGYRAELLRKELNDFSSSHHGLSASGKDILDIWNQSIETYVRKPVIKVAGTLASGKSTIINALVGERLLPINTITSPDFPVWLRHIDERPNWLFNETYLFRQKQEGGDWDASRINEKGYFDDWVLTEGIFDQVIHSMRQRQLSDDSLKASFALTFARGNILKDCDIVRLPNRWLSDTKKESQTFDLNLPSHGLIFLIPANSSLSESDCLFFRSELEKLEIVEKAGNSELPTLSNLFIVVSRAHFVGSEDKLQEIMDAICTQLYEIIPESYWIERQASSRCAYSKEVFRSRFFSYATDTPELRVIFESELKRTVEALPRSVTDTIVENLRESRDKICAELERHLKINQEIRKKPASYHALIDELNKNEVTRWTWNAQQRDKILNEIRKHKQNTLSLFDQAYEKILSEQNIQEGVQRVYEQAIPDETEPNRLNSTQVRRVGVILSHSMEACLKKVLLQESERFCEDIEEYLSVFESKVSQSGFSPRLYFEKSLQSKAHIGAFVIWRTPFNPDINRDSLRAANEATIGYANDDTKAVEYTEVITSYDDSFFKDIITHGLFGTAIGAMTVGGVIGPMIGATAGVLGEAVGKSRYTSEKRISTKIQKAYSSKSVLLKYEFCIERFWEETSDVLTKAIKDVELSWKAYWRNLQTRIQKDFSELDIENEEINAVYDFLRNLLL